MRYRTHPGRSVLLTPGSQSVVGGFLLLLQLVVVWGRIVLFEADGILILEQIYEPLSSSTNVHYCTVDHQGAGMR